LDLGTRESALVETHVVDRARKRIVVVTGAPYRDGRVRLGAEYDRL